MDFSKTQLDYAQLSANVYGAKSSVRSELNTLQLPNGWNMIGERISPTGFMAKAYRNAATGEVVIAYAGTTGEDGAALNDWVTGNIPAGVGAFSQAYEAIAFYLEVLKLPGVDPAKTSFTGHSLGGGLASLMAVYFDKKAVVFDQAPFELSAATFTYVAYQAALELAGYTIPQEFYDYDQLDYSERKSNVQQVVVAGEVLSYVTGNGFKINDGNPLLIDPEAESLFGWGGSVGADFTKAVDLHSMTLLAGFMKSEVFIEAAKNFKELLPRIFDGAYKNIAPTSRVISTLLELLVQRQIAGEASLDALAADLAKIVGTDLRGADGSFSVHENGDDKQINLAAALIDVVLAGLYQQANGRTPQKGFTGLLAEVLTRADGYVGFDAKALGKQANPGIQSLSQYVSAKTKDMAFDASLLEKARWGVQDGGAMHYVGSELDARSDVVIALSGNNTIATGGGDDLVLGGKGNDDISGGSGNDRLYGGAGTDHYRFYSNDSVLATIDRIYDSGGDGVLYVDDVAVTAGARLSETTWQDATGNLTLTWVPEPVGSLIVKNLVTGDTIYVEKWSNTQFGITLSGEVPVVTSPAVINLTDNADAYGEFGANDANDVVIGLAGNDGIEGGAGDDRLDGGAGDDLILGGSGDDHLYGGAGNDFIVDGSEQADMRPWTSQEQAAVDNEIQQSLGDGTIVARGAGWYIVQGGALDGVNGLKWNYLDPDARPSGNDVIDAGDGDDYVLAGEGDDIVVGGAGADAINGGHGHDILYGGDGNDTIVGDPRGVASSRGLLTFTVSAAAEINGNDIIDAGDGDDVVIGSGGNDIIHGGLGNDNLQGFAYGETKDADDPDADYIDGGDGNDTIGGGDGNDTLFGGSGNDVMAGDDAKVPLANHGDDLMDGGAGDDLLEGFGGNDTLLGGDGVDTLLGDSLAIDAAAHGDDILKGGAGDDIAAGMGGSDVIYGDDGDDQLIGDANPSEIALQYHGDDALYGGAGADKLWGGGGNDLLDGGTGADMLSGETGDDRLLGGAGADELFGGEGNDVLAGGADNDVLWGGLGGDSLDGGDGDDTLSGEDGADVLVGGNGADTLSGGGDADTLSGGDGADILSGGDGNDTVSGGTKNDQLYGDGGDDALDGGDGNDTLSGGTGNDTLVGGAGNDSLSGGVGNNRYLFDRGFGVDVVTVTAGAIERITFQDGLGAEELAFARSGDDLLVEVVGQPDRLTVAGFFVAGSQAAVYSADGQVYTASSFASDYMLGGPTRGGSGSDSLQGASQAGRIYGMAGDDTLRAGSGGDLLDGGSGNDTLTDGIGNDVMLGGTGNDVIHFGAQGPADEVDIADGGAGNDIYHVAWYSGADTIKGLGAPGSGSDRIVLDNIASTMVNNFIIAGDDLYVMVGQQGMENMLRLEGFLAQGAPAHTLEFSDAVTMAAANFNRQSWQGTQGDDTYEGTAAPDQIVGYAGNDVLSGGMGDDQVNGGDGDDILHGNAGNDILVDGKGLDVVYGDDGNDVFQVEVDESADRFIGGAGDDAYYFRHNFSYMPGVSSAPTFQVEESADGGVDTIYSIFYDITLAANVENLVAEHSRFSFLQNGQYIPRNLIGNDLANTISIAAPTGIYSHRGLSYLLDGKGGDDVLKGSDANEIYVVDSLGDVIVEPTVPGYNSIDTVRASISYSLEGLQGIENIELTADGTSATGDAGNNRLDGAMAYGANTLIGGGGDDAYAIDYLDTIVEDATGGVDTAIVMRMESRSFTVAEGRNVEIYRVGEALYGNNTLRGSSEANILIGNSSGNYLYGGAGNDELRSGGNSGSGYTDFLSGDEGDDLLVSGSGLTGLSGGRGDDEIVLAMGKDSFYYGSGDGRDLIRLADASTESGSGTILFSSEIRSQDVIWSRQENDLILSFQGAASDSITVRNYWAQSDAGDVATGVIDEFYFHSDRTTRKGTTLEQLRNAPPVVNVSMLWSSAVIGSQFAYTLPADTFVDDQPLTYSVSNLPGWLAFDSATATFSGTPDSASQWSSTLTLTATDPLGQSAQVLVSIDVMNQINGTSAADALVGTDAPDIMYGLAGNDTLNGGLSADEMYGGIGDDVYTVDAYRDRVIEFAAEGNDLVNAYIDYDLTANVERLTLLGSAEYGNGNDLDNVITGNASANVLTGGDGNDTLLGNNGDDDIEGGSGNDTLNGGAGSDYMRGGEGNDTYVVASAGDVVEEWASQGVDTVQSSIGYTLADNVENLTLTGSSGLAGSGNGGDNVLTGNSGANTLTGYEGNDTLDGGAGNDTMLGGVGDDTYMVGATGDIVTERVDEGMDTVLSAISYTLGSNVENLSLSGTSAINGTGNAIVNLLVGNSGNNALSALGGNDTLDGRSGTDTLTGGVGDDVYLFGRTYGADTVVENDSSAGNADVASFVTGVAYDQLWFRRPSSSNNLEISIIGTSDKLTIKDWYLGEQYRVESIRTQDGGKVLYAADVQALVNAMAGTTAPSQGQTTLSAKQRAALDPVFSQTWREQSTVAQTLSSSLDTGVVAHHASAIAMEGGSMQGLSTDAGQGRRYRQGSLKIDSSGKYDVDSWKSVMAGGSGLRSVSDYQYNGMMSVPISESRRLIHAMAIADSFESGVFHRADHGLQPDILMR
ncbi:hypothetical protein FZ025_12685 [Xanthomonas hyacinthi]|uniref:Dystroglycan-type cadherin-like domain-containing protein n=1 Tax=Xanthomonas hyacinthi TaxID=56455 RepID=A0A2S7EZV4_9XANT|nr:calcium-binding protein [Xanthomonas hyacinthi]PPU98636.1 hypothetical protein XhyaCFBP1156_04365 [Xanthomonas hyacinthi]QGY77447.1 hypothetical protein FZ025_12685 [Xanthomonas hyacinthi]